MQKKWIIQQELECVLSACKNTFTQLQMIQAKQYINSKTTSLSESYVASKARSRQQIGAHSQKTQPMC